MKGKIRKEEGITLVALVVTIIVLLILAGVSLSMVFNQDGIFKRAENATDKYGQSKAHETLELALGEAQMQKYEEGLTDEQLTEKINTIGEELPKEKPEHPELQNVIVDGHIFEIDRSVPKIVDYIGPANGVIITASVTQNGNWENPIATLSGTIKTYSGGYITSSTATVVSGNANVTGFPTNGGDYTIANITEDTVIKITAHDSNNKEAEKTINVQLVRDITGPTIKSVDIKAEGLKIIISATAEDNESGLKQITYSITPETGLTQATGLITNGNPIEITSTEEKEYTVTIIAEDNAKNKSEPQSQTVITEDVVYKHIKTQEGLKKVKAKDVYGATVTGYTCGRSDAEWQIFYIDEEDDHRVYLIAKDYMAPPTTGTELTKSTGSSYPKSYCWNTNVLSKFTGPIPKTSFTNKFLSEYAGATSSVARLQATNYMLDETVWGEYLNNTRADYVSGGPTISLFVASYNDICKRTSKVDCQSGSGGYYVKQGTGQWDRQLWGLGDINTQKGIYFNGENNSAYSMWIASGVYSNVSYLYAASYNGSVSYSSVTSSGSGFRPIVGLNTETLFLGDDDENYSIQ